MLSSVNTESASVDIMYHYEQSSDHPDTCSVARMPTYTCFHTHTTVVLGPALFSQR